MAKTIVWNITFVHCFRDTFDDDNDDDDDEVNDGP